MSTQRTLLVVSARDSASTQADIAAGRHPRRDYALLREALGADIIDAAPPRGRVGSVLGPVVHATRAFWRSRGYDNVYADGEHTGLPLAAMLRLRRRRPRLTMIGHYLTPPKKKRMMRALGLARVIDGIALHSPVQAPHAHDVGFDSSRTPVIPYQVDTEFWQPQERPLDDLICAVGLEFRDYATLIEAARAIPVRVEIATGSPWSKRRFNYDGALPPNVTVTRHEYAGLRDLYARSRFVVVPLQDVDFQAGIIAILESMAMGKAVIVTRTQGQVGTVSGPMFSAAGAGDDVADQPAYHANGIYVPPGDAAALRTAIEHLVAHPEEAARMGANGRRMVTEQMSIERFAERMSAFIRGDGAAAS